MNTKNELRKAPVRQIIGTSPLVSVLHLNGCKLTEVWIDGSWVCVRIE
ncbi:hypothetical protein [Paraburkholderia fungorum]|nr:hypothetical protein [Paraburkholderia fungorum]MBB5547726.1 hypothetical protein [Paraburkholderia fungorum]